jgi:ribonuclease P protein component
MSKRTYQPNNRRRANDVGRVVSTGRAFHGNRVVVFVAPGSGAVAFVAGRRVGGAVVRNRARRILRAAWREIAPLVRDGYDIALVARGAIRARRTAGSGGEGCSRGRR